VATVMAGKHKRYLPLAQRLWWAAVVLVVVVAGASAGHAAFGRSIAFEIAYLLTAVLVAWGATVWWFRLVGEPMPREEYARRIAAESLARPLWLDALLYSPMFVVHPFAPLVFGREVHWDVVAIWIPMAIFASFAFASWQRRRASTLLGV